MYGAPSFVTNVAPLIVSVQPTIVASALTGVISIIENAGFDLPALMSRVDISLDDMANPDHKTPLNSVCELLELVAQEARDDAYALTLASQYPVGSSGVLGYTMMTAPTLRHALQDVHRYARLLTPQQGFQFDESGPTVEVMWQWPEKMHRPSVQYVGLTIAMFVRRMQLAAGADWCPASVTLDIPRPKNEAAFEALFGTNVSFGAARSSMRFGKNVLDLRMPKGDERLHTLLRELGDYRLKQLDTGSDIVDRTQDQIIALLNHGPVSLEMVARDLGQSARSLQRRLKEEDTSFQIVLEKTRRLLARHYLRTKQHTLTEVAFLLGFSEQSAFTRACKRWFGVTPYEMRIQLRQF